HPGSCLLLGIDGEGRGDHVEWREKRERVVLRGWREIWVDE
nr:hypothetical protein [Tanacetum cinerariifolium]